MITPWVFLDTGIFIAFLNRRDRHHALAVSLFGGPKVRWATSALVRAETYSFFLHNSGEEAARSLRLFIESLKGLQIFDTTPGHHDEVCRILDRLRGAKLTYVDASSLAFMRKHGISRVWSTDHHLGLMGAEVWPRS